MANFVSVNFPASKIQPQQVYSLNLRQKMYEHDYAKVYFRDWNFNPRQIKPGSLMKITLNNKEFFGYVHDIESVQETNKNFTRVGFIGASYLMRQASRKIYKNVTADQVIIDIAKRYNFAYRAFPHPRVYPQIAQAGMTDWELMVRLAKQCGYVLRAENTELHFHPLMQDFEDLYEEALSFSKADAGFKSLNPIYSFTSTVSETLAHSLADKSAASVFGVNPVTGAMFGYTAQNRGKITRERSNQEFFDSHETNVVSNSYDVSVFEAAAALNKSQFPYVADAEVFGASKLRPAMPVYLTNLGKDYSGYWTILGVEHEVIEETRNRQIFTSKLYVGTDSLGETADGTKKTTPGGKLRRKIIPNTRNTRVIPTSIPKSPGLLIKPVNPVSLVKRVNRANISGPLTSSVTWSSTHGNLLVKKRLNTSSVIYPERLRANALL